MGNPLERLHSCVIHETNKLMRKWRTGLHSLGGGNRLAGAMRPGEVIQMDLKRFRGES